MSREVAKLAHLAAECAHLEDLSAFGATAVETVRELFGAAAVSLFWRRPDGSFERVGTVPIELGEAEPLRAETLPLARLSKTEPHLKALARPTPPPWLARRAPREPWESYSGVPLGWMGAQSQRQARLEGLLEIFWSQEQPELDADLLATVTHMLEMAIQNWRLFSRVLQERDFSQSVLETVSEGVITLDRQARVISLNRGAERILGSLREDLVGARVDEAVCSEDQVDWNGLLAAETPPRPFRVRVELPRLGKRDLHFFPSLPDKLQTEEEGPALVLVFRDITRQKELEELRNDFTATISHELRTPLMSIKGYLKTLQHSKARSFELGKVQEILGLIDHQTDHLHRLIQDLLEAARFNNETLEVSMRPTDLRGMLDAAIDGNRSVVLDCPAECWVHCDPEQILYVLGHLLSNALKFSKADQKITLLCEANEMLAWVTVKDEGVGIPSDQLENIFDMFHRVDTGDRRVHYGVGLGLFLARKIVEAHGGTITVASEPGRGSTFRFSLRTIESDQGGRLEI